MTKAGETDHNPSKSVLAPGALPTVLLDDPLPDDVYEKAIGRTLAWVGGAAVFAAGLFALAGPVTAEEFVAGYLVEQSLSVDNLFVFLLLFDYFKVPLAYQDRVLNWGIYGAIVMRAVLIGVGAAALQKFHAILLVFAGILVYSSANVLLGGEDEEEDMSENSIVQLARKLIDATDEYDGDRFFTVVEGVKKATPLLICMAAVEISDVVFAVDSIPAVFGVTEVSKWETYLWSLLLLDYDAIVLELHKYTSIRLPVPLTLSLFSIDRTMSTLSLHRTRLSFSRPTCLR